MDVQWLNYRNMKYKVMNYTLYVFDLFIILTTRNNVYEDVALVRLDAIGDFILFIDAAKEYRTLFPNKKIMLIANHIWADLAKTLPYWDVVYPVNVYEFSTDFSYRYKTIKELRQFVFHNVIHPTYSRDFASSDSIIRCLNSRDKIGFEGNCDNISSDFKWISNRWYSKLVKSSVKQMMELNRNAEFLRNLGVINFKSRVPNISSVLKGVKSPLGIDGKYIVIFPFASEFSKEWPIKSFIAIIKKINENHKGYKVVICGGPNDKKSIEKLIYGNEVEIIDLVGKTDLIVLAKIIQNSSFVLSNDSSGTHIASAVGTNSICIVGGGHFGRFVPYKYEIDEKKVTPTPIYYEMECFGCNWKCPYIPSNDYTMPCIKNISVNEVYKECLNYFE